MARYNYVSPWAMAGEGMLEVLTKRRADDRQRMLDEIAEKQRVFENEVATKESARAAQEATSAQEARAARTAIEKQQNEREALGIAREGLPVGAQPPAGFEERFQDAGLMYPSKMGEVPTESAIEGLMATRPEYTPGGYRGTQEQQEKASMRQRAGEVFDVLTDPTKVSKRLGTLGRAAIEGGASTGEIAALVRGLEPPAEKAVYNPDREKYKYKGKWVDELPAGVDFAISSRTPRPAAPPRFKEFQDAKTGEKFGYDPVANEYVRSKVPEGLGNLDRVGAPPRAVPGLISDTTMRAIAKARGLPPSTRNDQAWRSLAIGAITNAKTADPSVNEAAQMVFDGYHPTDKDENGDPVPFSDDPGLVPSAEDLYEEMKATPGVTPQEALQFYTLVKGTRTY